MFKKENQYNRTKKDGTKTKSVYRSFHGNENGISGGQKQVQEDHPDGSRTIKKSEVIKIKNPAILDSPPEIGLIEEPPKE